MYLASGRTRRSGRFRRNLLNSDADRLGTVCPDAVRHGICLPDGAWQSIFLLNVAISGDFPSGRSRIRAYSFWTQLCQGKWHPDDVCPGTVVTLAVKVWNISSNTHVLFTNTQQVPGIVTQSSSILYI